MRTSKLDASGQISTIPKPELRGFWGSSLIKPPFRVTSADVVIICPDASSPCFPGEKNDQQVHSYQHHKLASSHGSSKHDVFKPDRHE